MIGFSRLGRCGRLGNQLWQIASTAGIAHTLGQDVILPDWDYRPYFNVPDEFFPTSPGPRGYEKSWREANHTALVEHMDPRCREYLQDYHLWEEIVDQVWDWFQPSELAQERLAEEWFTDLDRPVLSIHIRRGDNAKAPNNNHPLRPWSYYEAAFERMRGKFTSIAVFSDDPDWCRDAFAGYEVEYPIAFFVGTPRKKEHEVGYATDQFADWIDLQLMSLCDRHIIGNSTFAWWGAFLSHDPAPIYPVPWFGTDLQYIDASLMMPESWAGIDHGQQHV